MTYSVRIKRSALEQLQKTDRGTRERLIGQIDRLARNPFVGTALEGELNGLRCVRHGAYRIVFEIRASELVVLVVRIGHRSQIYRRCIEAPPEAQRLAVPVGSSAPGDELQDRR